MRISDFNYALPDELIARYPPLERRDSRLLAVDVTSNELSDRQFADLPSLLEPGDLLVLNDTRVIPARLRGRKESGGKAEILVERITDRRSALALVKASKTPAIDSLIRLPGNATAQVTGRDDDLFLLKFSVDIEAYLEEFGAVPLPPYLGREAEPVDRDRYQCVYAESPGAIAAPTAGLHFDNRLLEELSARGIASCRVTLHVGAGTFMPLRSEQVESNNLHFERVVVTPEVCAAVAECRERGGRVIAVGTTSVRALEAASAGGQLAPMRGETDLFIYPGYRFRSVDSILTNFHLPQSSLLMLAAAFAGRERILHAYRHAVHAGYRFFSYGDAMLLSKKT
jgi:S-adenosylmethionine:tRNA ribosyltransferase-isomerase